MTPGNGYMLHQRDIPSEDGTKSSDWTYGIRAGLTSLLVLWPVDLLADFAAVVGFVAAYAALERSAVLGG